MASIQATRLKKGMLVKVEQDLFRVLELQHVTPGNLRGFVRVKFRNIRNGALNDQKLRSEDTVERAILDEKQMQYLYKDGDFWTFMNPESYEQLQAGEAAVGEAAKWLKDGVVCIITLWNGVPLLVTPPPHIELKVVETDPGLRGDTATGGQKPAKLETGAVVRVPLFINEGEVLRIDTRTGEYVSRAKS